MSSLKYYERILDDLKKQAGNINRWSAERQKLIDEKIMPVRSPVFKVKKDYIKKMKLRYKFLEEMKEELNKIILGEIEVTSDLKERSKLLFKKLEAIQKEELDIKIQQEEMRVILKEYKAKVKPFVDSRTKLMKQINTTNQEILNKIKKA